MSKYKITLNGKSYEIEVEALKEGEAKAAASSAKAPVSAAPSVKAAPAAPAAKASAAPVSGGAGSVSAPMPGSSRRSRGHEDGKRYQQPEGRRDQVHRCK